MYYVLCRTKPILPNAGRFQQSPNCKPAYAIVCLCCFEPFCCRWVAVKKLQATYSINMCMYVCMYVCIYIYIYISLSLSLSLSLSVYRGRRRQRSSQLPPPHESAPAVLGCPWSPPWHIAMEGSVGCTRQGNLPGQVAKGALSAAFDRKQSK